MRVKEYQIDKEPHFKTDLNFRDGVIKIWEIGGGGSKEKWRKTTNLPSCHRDHAWI